MPYDIISIFAPPRNKFWRHHCLCFTLSFLFVCYLVFQVDFRHTVHTMSFTNIMTFVFFTSSIPLQSCLVICAIFSVTFSFRQRCTLHRQHGLPVIQFLGVCSPNEWRKHYIPPALRIHIFHRIYAKLRTAGQETPAQFPVPRGDANEY